MQPTLDELRAEHTRFGNLIAAYERQLIVPSLIVLPEVRIHLFEGESYGGYLFGESVGTPGHHVILLPDELENNDWDESMEWGRAASGILPSDQAWSSDLPSQREQALLYANLPKEFKAAAYWSNEASDGDSSCARYQRFSYGGQGYGRKSVRLRARRVRRFSSSVI